MKKTKVCPICGTKMKIDTSAVCTSIPPMYRCVCPSCNCLDFIMTSEYDQYKEGPSLLGELEEAAEEYTEAASLAPGNEWLSGDIIDAFKAGAEWQEKQDLKWAGEIHKNGYNLCKEQLLKDAVEIEVKEDAGGYPYIVATELYDYENDKPLAKAGDKVKVIVIKEDEK